MLADIEKRLALFGENTADFPIALTQERRDDAIVWVVLLHVRVHRVTEFEIEAEGLTLSKALRCAYLALNNRPALLQRARKSNAAFGIAV